MATLIFIGACAAVGVTSPADGPFSIGVRPVCFGIDVDITIGTLHRHYRWSAFPVAALPPLSTNPASSLL